MFGNILFAIDDDDALPGAIPVVAAYATRGKARVRVLHVHRADHAEANGQDRRLVKAVIDRLAAEGVDATGEIRLVRRGETVAGAIAHAATGAEADLVVIGSHGRTDLASAFFGSVSHRVAAELDIPILVLRASMVTFGRPRHVLVATDGSEASDEAVAEAGQIATEFVADVQVLHVRQLIVVQGAAVLGGEDEARTIVDRAVTSLRRRGLKVSGCSVVNTKVSAAVAASAAQFGADLVVIGSRRPSDIAGLLAGSVGHEVVNRLRCPVLLSRRTSARQAVAIAAADGPRHERPRERRVDKVTPAPIGVGSPESQ